MLWRPWLPPPEPTRAAWLRPDGVRIYNNNNNNNKNNNNNNHGSAPHAALNPANVPSSTSEQCVIMRNKGRCDSVMRFTHVHCTYAC